MNKKIHIVTLLVGVFLLVCFALFSREVKQGFLKHIDFDVTVRLQDNMPKRFDEIWEDIAFFVSPGPSIFLIGLVTIVALVDWKNKKIRLRAFLIPVLFAALVYGELYGKAVVHHPAPPFFMIKNPTTIFPKYYVNAQYSYPSGHTARAAFFGVTFFSLAAQQLVNVRKKKTALIALGVALYVIAVSVGRIYLGHHWFSDILGGAMLGGGLGLVVMGAMWHD